MGIVVRFPESGRPRGRAALAERRDPATVIILPAIRIERHAEPAADETVPPKRPGRRGTSRGR